jgi:uncharacterized protein YgiM (DUF1202 family)
MKKPILAILALILASLACTMHAAQVASTALPVSKVIDTGTPQPATKEATVTAVASASIELETAQVTAIEALHVRVRPGEQSPLAKPGYLYHGQTVTILDCRDGWAQIRWESGRAWVNADYLSDNMCKE